MDKIGIENLSLTLTAGIEGECTLCDYKIEMVEQTYLFTDGETLIMAFHGPCFNHLSLTISRYILINAAQFENGGTID